MKMKVETHCFKSGNGMMDCVIESEERMNHFTNFTS